MSSAIGFVGLGVMGAPMAGHLLRSGHDVAVWARNPEQTRSLSEQGARLVATLEELGEQCDAVFLCVNRTEDVEECIGRLTARAPMGRLFVDHSTISVEGARGIHRRLEGKHLFLDAPITGGSMGARNGSLTIFCGGSAEAFAAAEPYLRAYSKRAELVGGAGAGQMMKVVNQIAVAGSLLALCEALAFASKGGLDLAQTLELVGSGAAGSWAFDNYGPKVLMRDWSPGFSVRNQRKDLGYVMEAASAAGAQVPGARLVDGLLAKLEEEGHGDWTTAALFELMAR